MLKYCKLTKYKQQKLQKLFLAGVSARKAAEIVAVHRNSATRFFRKLRILMPENIDNQEEPPSRTDQPHVGKQREGNSSHSTSRKSVTGDAEPKETKVRGAIIKDASSSNEKSITSKENVVRYCKLSKYKQQRLQKLFLAGVSARKAAEIVAVHRNSATRFFRKLRILTPENIDKEIDNEIE